ncbi:metallophos domain-containing protein [Vibrio phage 15E36.1]|uniref:Metallophos domain-containing protein n=1 Tax=Vibrio phage 15E36.1 TaxID=2859290 RepID=A0AAE8C508_9CAUD|nr:metallophos domain-containing protein [Vibrio phage 15E36.1]
MTILVIPDTQVTPEVCTKHISAAGRLIAKDRPETVVVIGDWWDFESLSYYDKGKAVAEGRRLHADLKAGGDAMNLLLAPLKALQKKQKKNRHKVYQPRLIFCWGNHEERLTRYMNDNPATEGMFNLKALIKSFGFEFYDFLEIVEVENIMFSHYFANPLSGRPWGGMINNKIAKIGKSFVQGHVQTLEYGERYLNNGEHQFGLVAGAFYTHDEAYKGAQGNHHFRGLVKLHTSDERTDVEFVSINRLMKEYK